MVCHNMKNILGYDGFMICSQFYLIHSKINLTACIFILFICYVYIFWVHELKEKRKKELSQMKEPGSIRYVFTVLYIVRKNFSMGSYPGAIVSCSFGSKTVLNKLFAISFIMALNINISIM